MQPQTQTTQAANPQPNTTPLLNTTNLVDAQKRQLGAAVHTAPEEAPQDQWDVFAQNETMPRGDEALPKAAGNVAVGAQAMVDEAREAASQLAAPASETLDKLHQDADKAHSAPTAPVSSADAA